MNTAVDDSSGKVVVVTGAARGIGAAVGSLLRRRGAQVVLCDVQEIACDESGAGRDQSVLLQKLDVTSENAWAQAIAAALGRFNRIDALVNCAGLLISHALLDFDLDDFKRVIDVNLRGAFLGIKHAAPAIAAAGGGSIVNISSAEGLQGSNSMAAYASSKWGLRGLTRVAAIELGQSLIRVNSVYPGPIDTLMLNPERRPLEDLMGLSMLSRMPLSRIGNVAEVAELCAFLLGDGAKFITGAEISIDGGLTVSNINPTRPGSPKDPVRAVQGSG